MDHRGKHFHSDFLFYPGACGKFDPTQAHEVEDVYLPWKYMTQPQDENKAMYDFALLKLKQPIKKKEGEKFIPLSGKW